MSFNADQTKTISNRALFSLIDNKKQTIESLQEKRLDSKAEEIEFCYLIREKQKRFHKPEKHPQCCTH